MSVQPVYLGEFEHLVLLAILQCGEEAYTVPVRELLQKRTGRSITRGALYTSLDRLEAKKLVASRFGDPLAIRGGRARRYFSVTPAGMTALRAARTALANLSRDLESVLDRP